MKKLLTGYILMLAFGLGYSQKMAYVDTQYILKQMPQYQSSEQRLNNEVKKWQDQIVIQRSKIEKLRISFENEKILLTEDQQKRQLATIDSTEKVLNDFIDKKFGSNGESITLRYNLAKPIQDQIWNAINTVASKDKYNIVFDKSSDLIMIFTDSKYDITDKVLKQLGVNDKNAGRKEEGRTTSKNVKGEDSKTNETIEDNRNEEVTDNKPKTGYGSKYKSKKETKKAQNKESNKEVPSPTEASKTVSPIEESSKPKTGYGSKYTPKKKKETTEIKESDTSNKEENNTSSGDDKVESKKTEKSKPKTGYGSKYVPKKKNENNK